MNEPLRLISLNVEKRTHLTRAIPFLKEHRSDVVCLQELSESTITQFEEALETKCMFAKMSRTGGDANGIGIFSRLPVQTTDMTYYAGADTFVEYDYSTPERDHATQRRVLLWADVEKGGATFRIANTHFTWAPHPGIADEFQKEDIPKLLASLAALGEFALCGDFNAPRRGLDGGIIWNMIAEKYKDNIPEHYITSLDRDLHRAGHLDRMVDGLFTTRAYRASDVELVCGVSDHCAVVGNIARNEA